ncbi:hypothetical protein, partial [Barnesiella intestinihominis]|uniref:hypothetical protein n=1 Tax=Barnesiella intestinihominis TaxID=487174 RepID=UPI003AAA46A4
FLSCRASGRHTESVFALSSSENVEVFDNNGTTNSTHFLLAYGKAYFVRLYPISIKCGVSYRLSLLLVFPQPSDG